MPQGPLDPLAGWERVRQARHWLTRCSLSAPLRSLLLLDPGARQKSSSSASSEASETCQSVSECSSPTSVSPPSPTAPRVKPSPLSSSSSPPSRAAWCRSWGPFPASPPPRASVLAGLVQGQPLRPARRQHPAAAQGPRGAPAGGRGGLGHGRLPGHGRRGHPQTPNVAGHHRRQGTVGASTAVLGSWGGLGVPWGADRATSPPQHGEEVSPAASDLAMVLTRGLSLEHQKSSRDSLQYSSGYSTQTTTPSCSEDTIPSQGTQGAPRGVPRLWGGGAEAGLCPWVLRERHWAHGRVEQEALPSPPRVGTEVPPGCVAPIARLRSCFARGHEPGPDPFGPAPTQGGEEGGTPLQLVDLGLGVGRACGGGGRTHRCAQCCGTQRREREAGGPGLFGYFLGPSWPPKLQLIALVVAIVPRWPWHCVAMKCHVGGMAHRGGRRGARGCEPGAARDPARCPQAPTTTATR